MLWLNCKSGSELVALSLRAEACNEGKVWTPPAPYLYNLGIFPACAYHLILDASVFVEHLIGNREGTVASNLDGY